MSTKTSTQPTRRTPLSLSGATSKQQQQQQQQQQSSNNSRNENKPTTSNPKTEQTATTATMQKDNKNNNKQQNIVDKRTQQQNTKVASNSATSSPVSAKKPERNDDNKKTQNGLGNGNSNNGNAKEKHQNGKETSTNEKSAAANIDKKEKLEKEKEKKKELEKEKEKEKEIEIEKAKALEKEKADALKKEKEELAKKEKEEIAKKEKEELAKKEKEEALIKEKEQALQKEKEKEKLFMEKEKEKAKDDERKPEKEPRAKRSTAVEATEKKHQQDDKKPQLVEDDVEQMDISSNDEKESSTPATPTRRMDEHKFETPKKHEEKSCSQATPSKTTPRSATPSSNQSSSSLNYTTTVRTVTTTTTIDDEEMEPLLVEEPSPKKTQSVEEQVLPASKGPKPTATSTPGKFLTFKEIFFSESPKKVQQIDSNKLPDRHSCPRSFSQISGRRSIRPGSDAYTYSYFQNDAHYRESYRRINTELDVTSNTNTSLNVTVGSEVPNNSSFSFFGRGRKRDRTPPNVEKQSTVDLDLETSPKSPKRARIDMHGFFSAVSSPLTLLRSRFSKTSIQSSTPVKLRLSSKLSAESAEDEEVEVQNVSGISIEEELEPAAVADNDDTATEDITVGNEADEKKELSTSSSSSVKHESAINAADSMAIDVDADAVKKLEKCSTECQAVDTDSKHDKNTISELVNTEGGLVAGGDAVAKNKKCSIM